MDETTVHKVFTYKSGYFVFSRNFSEKELLPLIIEANVLYRTIHDLPILPSVATKLEEEIIVRSIFGTDALEGNPLTESKVEEIINNPAIVEEKH
jgi:hypothetical protein